MYYSDWSLLGFWVKSHIDFIIVEFEHNSYLRLCSIEVMLAPSTQTAPVRSRADALNFFCVLLEIKLSYLPTFLEQSSLIYGLTILDIFQPQSHNFRQFETFFNHNCCLHNQPQSTTINHN